MSMIDDIKHKVEKLPLDKQQDVLRYVEDLEREQAPRRPLRNPRGALAGEIPDISFEEFKQNRREMWGNSTGRELDHPT